MGQGLIERVNSQINFQHNKREFLKEDCGLSLTNHPLVTPVLLIHNLQERKDGKISEVNWCSSDDVLCAEGTCEGWYVSLSFT